MSIGGRIFAGMYDRAMVSTEAAGLRDHRRALLAPAKGDVLEIGAGTGANAAHYPAALDTLTVVDPEPAMLRRLGPRVRRHVPDALVLRAPAEELPFADDTFDVAVSTLVLCTVADPARALRELRRVLRTGGTLLFIEHVRADDARLARWQDRLNGLNRLLGQGCNCNRSTLDAIAAAGFAVRSVRHDDLPKAPAIVRPLIIGTAENV